MFSVHSEPSYEVTKGTEKLYPGECVCTLVKSGAKFMFADKLSAKK